MDKPVHHPCIKWGVRDEGSEMHQQVYPWEEGTHMPPPPPRPMQRPSDRGLKPLKKVVMPAIWRVPFVPPTPLAPQNFEAPENTAWERDLVPPPEQKPETWRDRPPLL